MPETALSDLTQELHRLVDLAGTDEHTANQGFATLLETYGYSQVAPALASVITEYMTASASSDYLDPHRAIPRL